MGYGEFGVVEDIRVFLHPGRNHTCLKTERKGGEEGEGEREGRRERERERTHVKLCPAR